MKKKKSKLQKKKDNPRSKYWESKADALWGAVVHHLWPVCAVNSSECAGRVEAHHLIGRGNKATRHAIKNGIGVCTLHHKWSNKLSAHGAPLAFAEWLQEYDFELWCWCSESKNLIKKADHKGSYEGLVEWCTNNAPELLE